MTKSGIAQKRMHRLAARSLPPGNNEVSDFGGWSSVARVEGDT